MMIQHEHILICAEFYITRKCLKPPSSFHILVFVMFCLSLMNGQIIALPAKKGKPNVNESSSKVSLEAAIEEMMDELELELEEIPEEAPIETALSLCVGWFGSLSTKCTKRPIWL